jgi:hypothetical protein
MRLIGRRFDSDFFIGEVLDYFDDQRAETRKRKRSNGAFLHLDNAQPQLAQAKFDSLSINRLSHSPYSPDIVLAVSVFLDTLK